MRHGDGHEAEIGRKHVTQALPQHDVRPAHSLAARQQHIVRAQLLHQPVAHKVGIVPQVAQHDDGHRQDQVHDPVADIVRVADAVGPGARQPAQRDGKQQDQHQ